MGQATLSESLRAVEAEIAAGQPERALESCQQIAARYPQALAVQRVLGEIYLALRKPREALGALDRVLGGNPEDARACCARAIVHQIHGNSAGALAFYRRACDISPDDQVLRSVYRELATSLGQPPYQPSRTGLARLYMRGDLLQHAVREWESLVAEEPDSLEAQVGLAEALWRSGNFTAAADRCRRIVTNAPACVKALLLLAVMELDGGDVAEAQRLIRRVAELDPDQRIAQALFVDRLAGGDRRLRAILIGEATDAAATGAQTSNDVTGGPSVQRASAWSRPLVDQSASRPVNPSQPMRAPAPSAPLVPPRQQTTAAPRPSVLPTDFHNMFAETEYMLWDRDETEKRAAIGRLPGSAGSIPLNGSDEPPLVARPPDRARPSSSLVPPALRDQGFRLEETEARAAINWVNWLQAQGAKPHGNGTTGPLRSDPAREGLPSLPLSSGTLPQATPEALRQMFAVLESDVPPERFVESEIVQSLPSDAPQFGAPTQAQPEQADADLFSPAGPRPHAERDGFGADSAVIAAADHTPDAPITLESLERDFASSGFQKFDLAPGSLSSLATEAQGHDESPTFGLAPTPLADDASGTTPETPPEAFGQSYTALQAVATEMQEARQPARPTEPADDDYDARLERARRWQAEDRTNEALAEYRSIIKNAPGLLPDVMEDLRQRIVAAPDDPEAHRLLGDAYVRQGEYLGALESYNRAVALTDGSS